jgi:hypothetical protein
MEKLGGADVPEANDRRFMRAGQERSLRAQRRAQWAPAPRREGEKIDAPVGAGQDTTAGSALHLPNANEAIVAAARQQAAIRTEGERIDALRFSLPCMQGPAEGEGFGII